MLALMARKLILNKTMARALSLCTFYRQSVPRDRKHCRRVMFLSSQTASFIVCEIVRANSNNAAS
jgi:hypothetical protein